MPVEPAVYFPTRQFPFSAVTIAISAHDTATALGGDARRRCVPSRRTRPSGTVETWRDRFNTRTAEPRLLMTTLTCVRRAGGVPGGARGLRALLVVGRLAPARAGDSPHAGRAAVSRWQPPSCATASCSSRSASPAGGCSSSRLRARWPPCSLASRPSDAASTVHGGVAACSSRRSSPACLPRGARCASIRLRDCGPNSRTTLLS